MKPIIPNTPAGRLAYVLDLYAPPVYDDEGNFVGRDPEAGLITREQAMELLEGDFAS